MSLDLEKRREPTEHDDFWRELTASRGWKIRRGRPFMSLDAMVRRAYGIFMLSIGAVAAIAYMFTGDLTALRIAVPMAVVAIFVIDWHNLEP